MALGHSPQIVTNGLVFAYDMANTQKSWKGAPTTNLISASGINASVLSAYPNMSVSQVVEPESPSGYAMQMQGQTGVTVSARSAMGENTNYPTSGTAYISIMVKKVGPGSAIQPGVWSGAAWYAMSPLDGGSIYITDTYRRFGVLATMGASSPPAVGFSMFQYSGNIADTTTITKWHSPQLEVQSFATPFVGGIRSNTQALIDLTGQNTITANSLTYASDGTFNFNGTSNFLNCGSNSVINLTTEISIESWFNAEATGSGIVTYGSTLAEQYALWATENKIMFSTSWPTPWQLAYSNIISLNTWYHAVATFKNGAWKIYKNGVLDTSGTFAVTTLPAASGGYLLIGNNHPGGQEYFKGQIPVVKIYNRELLAAEVKQNFNAYRGRYGI